MAVHKSFFFRRFLSLRFLAAGLLALFLIGVEIGAVGGIQPAAARQQPIGTPTPTPPLTYLTSHGNTVFHELALTFDDGPAPDTTTFLDILRQYHVPATFFMVGQMVQNWPTQARAVFADGHAIGDHTWDHSDLTTLSTSQIIQELTSTRTIIQQMTGITTTIFRPPYGSYNSRVLDTAFSLKFSTIIWSCDPADWSRPGVSVIISRVLNCAQNGSIVLMHDGGGDRSQTIAALPTIIQQLQARGYTFVTIPQLLIDLKPPAPLVPTHSVNP